MFTTAVLLFFIAGCREIRIVIICQLKVYNSVIFFFYPWFHYFLGYKNIEKRDKPHELKEEETDKTKKIRKEG